MTTNDDNIEHSAPVVSAANAPPGSEALDVEWVHISVSGCGVMPAAIARPTGAGPFPVVLLLHGTHGFAQEYVRLASDLASGGLVAVAAGWFRGGSGAGSRFITPISCPDAPAMPDASSREAFCTVESLVLAVRGLPGADPERIGIFGHSRGGGAALNYGGRKADIGAVVLNSSRYPDEAVGYASKIEAPLLMLHGTADSPDDGGSAATDIAVARRFETALMMAGKPVQAVYYEGGRHNSIFTSRDQYRDEVGQMNKFLRHHLLGAR